VQIQYMLQQSFRIAGGHPSSSGYFDVAQADNPLYLDPQHAQPAIPLRVPPTSPPTSSLDAQPALADDDAAGPKRLRKGSSSLGGHGSPLKSASAGWCPDSEDNPLTPGLGMTFELCAPPPWLGHQGQEVPTPTRALSPLPPSGPRVPFSLPVGWQSSAGSTRSAQNFRGA
jgi:hypothetical protein